MRFLSLFAGIGGFDLGLERAGMRCVGQVEIDPYCRDVLAKHWPKLKRMEDVRLVRGDEFGPVDLLCGGVPCQPASCAGKRKGSDDERWLWGEWNRLIRAIRPAWFVAENVRGFLSLAESAGVVREMEGAGYEVRTLLLGAHHVGAPHRRDRIWIIGRLADAERHEPKRRGGTGYVGVSSSEGARAEEERERVWDTAGDRCTDGVANPQGPRREGDEPAGDPRAGGRAGEHGGVRWPARPGEPQHGWEAPRLVHTKVRIQQPDTRGTPEGQRAGGTEARGGEVREGVRCSDDGRSRDTGGGQPQSGVGVATDGLPRRLAGLARRSALKALGNAVVPQVAEVIGRAIMETERPQPAKVAEKEMC